MAAQQQAQFGVAGRYASALYELGDEGQSLETIGADLSSLQMMLSQSAELQQLVGSPVYKSDDQAAALEALAKKAGLSATTVNFLKVLCHNRRLNVLSAVITSYEAMVAEARGEAVADVTSAEKLSAQQTKDLKAALKAATGRTVTLNPRVDRSILGGLIVKMGSRMMDNSLLTKLQNLKISMKGTG